MASTAQEAFLVREKPSANDRVRAEGQPDRQNTQQKPKKKIVGRSDKRFNDFIYGLGELSINVARYVLSPLLVALICFFFVISLTIGIVQEELAQKVAVAKADVDLDFTGFDGLSHYATNIPADSQANPSTLPGKESDFPAAVVEVRESNVNETKLGSLDGNSAGAIQGFAVPKSPDQEIEDLSTKVEECTSKESQSEVQDSDLGSATGTLFDNCAKLKAELNARQSLLQSESEKYVHKIKVINRLVSRYNVAQDSLCFDGIFDSVVGRDEFGPYQSPGNCRVFSLQVNPAILKVAVILLSGMFGSIVFQIIGVVHSDKGCAQPPTRHFWLYVTLGALMAFTFFVFLSGGTAILGTSEAAFSNSNNIFMLASVGVLVGMFSDRAANYFSQRFDMFIPRADPDDQNGDARVGATPNKNPTPDHTASKTAQANMSQGRGESLPTAASDDSQNVNGKADAGAPIFELEEAGGIESTLPSKSRQNNSALGPSG